MARKKTISRRVGTLFFTGLFALFLILLGIVVVAWSFRETLFQVYHVEILKTQYPRVIFDVKTETTEISIDKKRPPYWINLSEISKVAVGAIVVSEDWAFFQHEGIDLKELKESFEKNWRLGKYARGGSTITQQVIKNVFLSREKSLWRKIREIVLAIRMDELLSKHRILEIYLNVIEFGHGLYGIGPASHYYFNKHPSQLTAKEGAFLAMLLPSPKKNSASFKQKLLTPFAERIIRSILEKMLKAHYINDEDYLISLDSRLSFETAYSPETEWPHSSENPFVEPNPLDLEEPDPAPTESLELESP